MNLTSLYKSIKISKKSVMWITLFLIAIITIPLLTKNFIFFPLREGNEGGDEGGDDSPPESSPDPTAVLSDAMEEEAAEIEAQQAAATLQTSMAENQKKNTVIQTAKTGVTTVEGDISSFNSKLLNIKTKIDELEPLVQKQTELETTITTSEIESDITAAEAEKIINTGNMSTKLQSVQGDVATFKGELNAVLARMENLDNQLIELSI